MEQTITIRDTGIMVGDVIRELGEGKTYEQVLADRPGLTLPDILASLKVAGDVLQLVVTAEGQVCVNGELRVVAQAGQLVSLDELRRKHPRAYAKWQPKEDNHLAALHKSGKTVKEIAAVLKRQEGAVWRRLQKLELIR